MASDRRARVVLTAVVRELVTFDEGHWCRTCMLPSGIRAWIAVRQGDRMHLQTLVYCDDCAGDAITIEHPPCR